MFFERPESGERAVLVHIALSGVPESEQDEPREFEALVLAAGGDPVDFILGRRSRPAPRAFVGRGKLDEIVASVKAHDAGLVIFNHTLSPSQERNLEQALQCRVLDRIGLILDIFAQRARTHEGKLQVELAQLQHMATRLVRGWTHLERQKGGIGLRGPGETQLETDRRLLRLRMDAIRRRLAKVQRQREQGRRARRRAEVPTVSLVGYTNAGKSTLFNRLTTAEVYAADQLFATLDPTLRRLAVPDFGPVVLADTVGFVRHLPHKLVDAFKATLEEACESDLLLHVVDAASEERVEQAEQVMAVLTEIGADTVPVLQVNNKIDCLPEATPRLDRDTDGRPWRVWVSARTGDGLPLLKQALAECLGESIVEGVLRLAPSAGRLRARLFELGLVAGETVDEAQRLCLTVRMPREDWARWLQQPGVDGELVREAAVIGG